MKRAAISHYTDEFQEKLMLYALGLLENHESLEVEAHLAECVSCSGESASIRETLAELPHALDPIKPHPRVRERLLAELLPASDGVQTPLPGIFVRRVSDQNWRSTPFPGVTWKMLYRDTETSNITSILRLEAGAKYPAHRHAAVEQCLVLEGTVRIGDIRLQAGDFEWAAEGTHHGVITSDSGCLLLILSNQHDEVFA